MIGSDPVFQVHKEGRRNQEVPGDKKERKLSRSCQSGEGERIQWICNRYLG